MSTDTAANRRHVKYTAGEQAKRVLWGFCRYLFRWSPRIAFRWRSALLRLFGARIGNQVHIYNTADIYFPWNLMVGDWSAIGEHVRIYDLGTVCIGSRVTISPGAHLCAGTHDHMVPDMPLLKPPITVHDQVWICADAFIGPGVIVGEGAVVGARAVVTRDVDPWHMVAGNPARRIGRRRLE